MSTHSAAAYYMSGYTCPSGDRAVATRRHDQNLALWRVADGRCVLVRHWELERLSGQKHHYTPIADTRAHQDFLERILAAEGLAPQDIAKSWGDSSLPGYTPLAGLPGSDTFPIHSLSHLFSGLLMDSDVYETETIVALAVDGMPDFTLDARSTDTWFAGAVSRRGHVEFLPVESPAPLYSACQRLTGLEPGTLMALQTACPSRIEFDADEAMARYRMFGGHRQRDRDTTGLVESVLTAAREQCAAGGLDQRFTQDENIVSAAMKIIQACCDVIITRGIDALLAEFGVAPEQSYLSMSGGYALNCPTNTRLLDRYGFKGLLTPPYPNDSGQAIGVGLLGLMQAGLVPGARVSLRSAFLGTPVEAPAVWRKGAAEWIESESPLDWNRLVTDLCTEPVAWISGRAESGPRALGHRSILGDPRSSATRDRLNEIKRRQWWRPVAPIVLADHAEKWFELPRESPFMLEAPIATELTRERAPAVVHLDGTARVQTVSPADDALIHELVTRFHAATGVPIVCNTSLNDKGEPIANTVVEALTFCVRRGIRVAYVDGVRVGLKAVPDAPERPARRDFVHYFAEDTEARDAAWKSWLDAGFSDDGIFLLVREPEARSLTPMEVNARAARLRDDDPFFAHRASSYRAGFGPGAPFSPAQ